MTVTVKVAVLVSKTIRDDVLLAALLSNRNIAEAAAAAGCGTRTVFRRLENKDFRRQLEEMQLKSLETARNGLLSRLTAAVDTMTDVMQDGENSPSTRLQAARLIIDSALRMVETVDHERRICELERREMARNGR